MRVAVLDDYLDNAAALADWGSLGPDTETTFFGRTIPAPKLAATLERFDVLVLMRERTKFPRQVLERLPNLRLLVTTGQWNASVDHAYLHDHGITYCGTGMTPRELDDPEPTAPPGLQPTAEVAWALILATTKRVTLEDAALRAGTWQTGLPITLGGKTLGLAGLGNLGSQMVAPAKAFGMEVIAWSENLTDERAHEQGVTRANTKHELLQRADVLSIHLQLSDRTRGLFAAEDLARMKPGAILINTSRGPIVDEAALVAGLRAGRPAAAGLDVFDPEPLPPGHPLTELRNTVLLPHLGYVTEAGLRSMWEQAVEDIAAFIRGEPIRVIGARPGPLSR